MARACFFNARTATLVLSFTGAVGNLIAATQVFSLWRSLRWEPESEWEGSVDGFRVDGLKIACGLFSAYFLVATMACIVGFVGVTKRIPSYVRLYRDFSVADLTFCAFSTILLAFASFRPAIRSLVCEELSRQPEILRSLAETGLSLENCELWFERAIVAFVAIMAILLVVRLQFTLTVSSYHAQLTHEIPPSPSYFSLEESSDDAPPHRIYLLPARSSLSPPTESLTRSQDHSHRNLPPNVLVYAPVSLDALSQEDTRNLEATETWVSKSQPSPRYHSRHSRRIETRNSGIQLPIEPGEGLLPSYELAGGFKV